MSSFLGRQFHRSTLYIFAIFYVIELFSFINLPDGTDTLDFLLLSILIIYRS